MRNAMLLLFSATLLAALAAVQDPEPGVRAPEPEILRRAHELAQLQPEHRLLHRLRGDWDVTTVTHVRDAEPREDPGKAAAQAMLAGRYVVLDCHLQPSGHALEAVWILGYDALRKLFTSSWRDTASTWPVRCEGEAGTGENASVLTLRGDLVDARSPDGRPFRMVVDLRKQDAVRVKLFEGAAKHEVLVQEQRWSRR